MGKFESLAANKWFRYGLIALGSLLLLTLVCGLGFAAGRWSASPFSQFQSFRPEGRNNFKSGHGAIGVIQSIQGQTITIQSRDGKLETILVDNETRFDKNFEKISFTDLQVNDNIVVIGSPNQDGVIKARLIGLVDSSFHFPSRPFQPGETR